MLEEALSNQNLFVQLVDIYAILWKVLSTSAKRTISSLICHAAVWVKGMVSLSSTSTIASSAVRVNWAGENGQEQQVMLDNECHVQWLHRLVRVIAV